MAEKELEEFAIPPEEGQQEGESSTPEEGQQEGESSTPEEEILKEEQFPKTEQEKNWKALREKAEKAERDLDVLRRERDFYKQQIEQKKPSENEEDVLREVASANDTFEFLKGTQKLWRAEFNEGAARYLQNILQRVNILVDEKFARKEFPDFQEMFDYMRPELEQTPALWTYISSLQNPAFELYNMALRKKAGMPDFVKKQREAGKKEIIDKLAEEKGHKSIKGGKAPVSTPKLSEMTWEQVKKLPPDVQRRYLMGET
jgi:hypothetical protein